MKLIKDLYKFYENKMGRIHDFKMHKVVFTKKFYKFWDSLSTKEKITFQGCCCDTQLVEFSAYYQ